MTVFPPRPTLGLAHSYAWCERVARRHAANFYHGFRLLPREQRRGMCALYAFLRVTDDLADGPGEVGEKRTRLEVWRRQWYEALDGAHRHPVHAALADTVSRFGVPQQYLDDVLDGVLMDQEVSRYETFPELYHYCYRVASAVGLACIHIWGFRGDEALARAEAAGIAFQLTNILRDVGEDTKMGRVYLPREDLDRFGYSETALKEGARTDAFRELMRFEAARARGYYEAGVALVDCLPPPGKAVFLVMLRTYRGVLDAIEQSDFDVFSRRIGLSRWHKLWLAARALPVCWGWL